MLLTKLHIPTPDNNLVHRSALFTRLDEGVKCKLILVSAPAGYGKTMLLSDWIAQHKIATGWYSLSKRDNAPREFLNFFVHAIQTVHKEVGQTSLELLQSSQEVHTDYVIELLINDLLEIDQHFFLVLDDFHLIEDQDIFQAVSYFLEHSPEHFHLIISTRSDPPMSLARLRSQHALVEIRAADLHFSTHDIDYFFNKKLRMNLSIDEAELLQQKTEGWIAGLQLTALSLQGREDIHDYLIKLAGDHRYIMDYLIEEVLDRQTEEVKEFLLKTSVLEMFSGSLCDAILERNDSQIVLETLEKNNMFIVRMDDERRWFRYHHLFADLLKLRLSLTYKESMGEIHGRASSWFEKEHMIPEAVDHALEAGNYEKAMQMLDEKVGDLWENGQNGLIVKFGSVFPEETIMLNKRFCIFYAWTLVILGKLTEAQKFLEYLEKTMHEDKEGILGKVYIALNLLYTFSGDMKIAFKYSELALKNLSATDPTWNIWAYLSYGEACHCRLDLTEAKESWAYALDISKQINNKYFILISNIEMAYSLMLECRYQESYALCNEQLLAINNQSIVVQKSLEIFTSMFHSMMGYILSDLNEKEEAVKHGEKGYELSRKTDNISFIGYCDWLLAITYTNLSEYDKALALIYEIEEDRRMTQLLTGLAYSLHIKINLLNGNLEAATKLLQKEEQRNDIINEYESFAVQLSKARYHLDQYEIEQALTLLDELVPLTKQKGAHEMLIEAELLRGRAYYRKHEKEKAVNFVMNAILLAQKEKVIRSFLYEGEEIENLVQEIRNGKQTKLPNTGNKLSKKYMDTLLSAFAAGKKQQKNDLPEELLSKRELDTLRLIAEDFTNQQIAVELFISLNTVKTHLKNINFKLMVDNRTKAVAKAKEIGLL